MLDNSMSPSISLLHWYVNSYSKFFHNWLFYWCTGAYKYCHGQARVDKFGQKNMEISCNTPSKSRE